MAREMGRNCCVNWWRPHQRAETFPNLFFFFFFFTTLTWFVSGKTGRTERRFKFCRLVLLPEWIRRRCHRPAPGKRRRRILWANTKWNCRDESTIWWAKKKMEATWVDCCCWTAFYSFDRRCRSFQMCLECWTESRWWAKMTATASRDLFWHEKRRRQTTKTKKTTRKTRNVHINRKRITSFLRITIFVFSKRFVDGLFFFFLFFCFLFFWNFEILAGKFIDIIKNTVYRWISLVIGFFDYLECLPQADRRDNIVRPLWRAFRSWEPVDWDIPNVGIQFCRICICSWRNPLVRMVPSLDAKSSRVGNI